MTIGTVLKALSVVPIVLAVGIAAVATTAPPADAKSKPVVRDHRTTPKWDRTEKKTNNPTVIRDHRSPPKWQPKTTKPRWPHYPHKH